MRVKLLQDIQRGGKVKVVAKRGRTPIALYAGAVVEASDTTAAKWIKDGQAEAIQEPAAA